MSEKPAAIVDNSKSIFGKIYSNLQIGEVAVLSSSFRAIDTVIYEVMNCLLKWDVPYQHVNKEAFFGDAEIGLDCSSAIEITLRPIH
ncbi:hypothetical protein [Roseobacter insulae]|uniref:hypothetical protein n=1 Tax=Roseobacter insulae TaxID=2859783 RepID=UPI00215180FE|nr:hypothetical protein [Roseobacter insulae]